MWQKASNYGPKWYEQVSSSSSTLHDGLPGLQHSEIAHIPLDQTLAHPAFDHGPAAYPPQFYNIRPRFPFPTRLGIPKEQERVWQQGAAVEYHDHKRLIPPPLIDKNSRLVYREDGMLPYHNCSSRQTSSAVQGSVHENDYHQLHLNYWQTGVGSLEEQSTHALSKQEHLLSHHSNPVEYTRYDGSSFGYPNWQNDHNAVPPETLATSSTQTPSPVPNDFKKDEELDTLPYHSTLSHPTLSRAFDALWENVKRRRHRKRRLTRLSKGLCYAVFLRNVTSDLAESIISGKPLEKEAAADRLLDVPGPGRWDQDEDCYYIMSRLKNKRVNNDNMTTSTVRKHFHDIMRNHYPLKNMLASTDLKLVDYAIRHFPSSRRLSEPAE